MKLHWCQQATACLLADHLVNQLLQGYQLLGINKVECLQTEPSLILVLTTDWPLMVCVPRVPKFMQTQLRH